jgi:hypothetical protein
MQDGHYTTRKMLRAKQTNLLPGEVGVHKIESCLEYFFFFSLNDGIGNELLVMLEHACEENVTVGEASEYHGLNAVVG